MAAFDTLAQAHQWPEQNDEEMAVEAIEIFIANRDRDSVLVSERIALKQRNLRVYDYLTPVDFDNDGDYDIIYEGPTLGEPDVVIFLLRTNTGYTHIFTAYQHLVYTQWEENKLSSIFIQDSGCCDSPELNSYVYNITYQDELPTFELHWVAEQFNNSFTRPESFHEPVEFMVTSIEQVLRANPWVDDTSKNYNTRDFGNGIYSVKQGFTGHALASATDDNNNEWWYVVMDNEYIYKDEPNSDILKTKPHKVGWLRSELLQEFE
jgi:hypothetical protein